MRTACSRQRMDRIDKIKQGPSESPPDLGVLEDAAIEPEQLDALHGWLAG